MREVLLALILWLALQPLARAEPESPAGVFSDGTYAIALRKKGAHWRGRLFFQRTRLAIRAQWRDDALHGTLDGEEPLVVRLTKDGISAEIAGQPSRALRRQPLDFSGTWADGSHQLRLQHDGAKVSGQLLRDGQPPAAVEGTRSVYRIDGALGDGLFSVSWHPAGVQLTVGKHGRLLTQMRVPGFDFLRFETFTAANDTEGPKRFRVAIYRNQRFAKALGLGPDKRDICVEFVRLPPDGRPVLTTLGCPLTEKGREPDEPMRQVQIDPFLIARTETTQQLWKLLKGPESKHSYPAPRNPATGITWYHMDAWCKAQGLSLPRGVQFEYANRAGTRTPFFTGVQIDKRHANISLRVPYHPKDVQDVRPVKLVAVGSYKPNAFGLFDTTGNAWEWCADAYPDTPFRIRRGGGFMTEPRGARSSNRSAAAPFGTGNSLAFRTVFNLPER